MSHAYAGVVIYGETPPDQIEKTIARLMEPYNENQEVSPYERDCWCLTAQYARIDKGIPEGQPDPECDECHGTGKEVTTYNERSKWDWYVIGGRWDGVIAGNERDDGDGGFNFGAEHHQLQYNMVRVSDLLTHHKDDPENSRIPRAIITPDGEWHERGKLGWFGMSDDTYTADAWTTHAVELLTEYASPFYIVGIDYHM